LAFKKEESMPTSESMNPERLLGISGSYWQTCALHAAVKLDLFTVIGKENKADPASIAEKTGVQERSLSMLLNALCPMGLLKKHHNTYSNTPEADTFLSKGSPRYVGYMIMHHHHLVESWSRLDESVMTGKPVRSNVSRENGEYRESFLMGMFNLAMGLAPQVVPLIDLSKRKRLLDLGGGPGTYAIHFCKHNPGLTATVFDLPTTRPFAEKTIARFDLKESIGFKDGNYVTGTIEGNYDVVWLSHILHGESPLDCEKIVKKAVSTLDPGGLIIIHDFILNNSKDAPLFPALFSLNMLLGTKGGQAYSESELFSMLEKAGVKQVKRTPFVGPNESGIITGIAP